MTVDLSAHGHEKVARIWIPYPITNANQAISNISVTGTYASSGVYTDREFQTPMLYARWDAGTRDRKLTLSFDVERKELIRRDFPRVEAAWDPVDYAAYLAPTRLGPIDGEIKVLAEKITAGETTVLGKAKAIYGWVPVDPADVTKMMFKEGLTLDDPKTEYYRDYFWGGVDPYRIKLGEGRDLVLNPVHAGEAVNYLMYPFAQISTKTLDWLAPETFTYQIMYHPQ